MNSVGRFFQAAKQEIEGTTAQAITVAGQLLNPPQAKNRILTGMMKDLQPDEPGKQLPVMIFQGSTARDPEPRGYLPSSKSARAVKSATAKSQKRPLNGIQYCIPISETDVTAEMD